MNTMFNRKNNRSSWPTNPAGQTRTIMIVEDDDVLLQLLSKTVEKLGHRAIACSSAEDALGYFAENAVDLILLDLVLPQIDGFEFCQIVRQRSAVPIIVVSALTGSKEVVRALDLGADEFLKKPFRFQQLEAMIFAYLRRLNWFQEPLQASVLQVGPITLDLTKRVVKVNEQSIDLTSRESDILEFLMRRPEQPHRYQDIYRAVWGHTKGRARTVIPVMILHLREKIEADPVMPQVITTVRGFGYRFERTSMLPHTLHR